MTHPPIIQSYQQPYIIDDPIPAAQHRTSAFCCHIIASFPCLHPTAHKAISFLPSFLLALSVSDQSPMFPVLSKEEQDALAATPVHPAGLVVLHFVKLAGTNRPIALAQANAINSRVDLLCEVSFLNFFGSIMLFEIIMLYHGSEDNRLKKKRCIVLGQLINRFSSGVLDRSMSPQTCDKPLTAFTLINLRKIGENSTL
ncbi:hypothetical protein B296_00007030 [Ensete ventricosum]|uniref:Uncharacterized protein n=1 Tax=Ensete ventricosum TaxID=4639 RepID=A0A427ASA2_ENSVE|nr:hypothetical protein B296_00007030 [Ensete ventricosum]